MNDNLSLSGAGGVTKSMTFEQKRRAAFEEWFRDKLVRDGVSSETILWMLNSQRNEYTDIATVECYEAWQAALEWQNKGERE